MLNLYRRQNVDIPVIITPHVLVVCLVENTFACAMLGIMVPEWRENVHVSTQWPW